MTPTLGRSRLFGDLGRDVRTGFRLLRRQPASSAVIILTLALGIGVNTAMFAVVDTVFLRRLPVADPDHLVLFSADPFDGTISGSPPVGDWTLFSSASYDFLRGAGLPVASIGAFAGPNTVTARVLSAVRDDRSPDSTARAQLVSGNYFTAVGVTASLGRTLAEADDRPEAAPVAVISDGFWRATFQSSRTALGASVRLNQVAFTIVGVAPASFFGVRVASAPDCWVPLSRQPEIQRRESVIVRPDYYWLSLVGHLAPGQSRAGAERAATAALRRFLTAEAGSAPGETTRNRILSSRIVMASGARGISPVRQNDAAPLALLSAAVGLVLLVACANVATLLVCRAAARSTDAAVRRALGASRLRLVRQGLTEAVVLALLGAAGGALLTYWLAPALLSFFPAGPLQATADVPILVFTVAVTLLSTAFFGLVPALYSARSSALAALRSSGRDAPARRGRLGVAEPFVIGQIALSLVLALGATLLARTLFNLEHEPLGFDQDGVLLTRIDPRAAGYTPVDVGGLYQRLYERVSALPGVQAATFARYSPFSGSRSVIGATVEGYTPAPNEQVSLETVPVGPNYPATLGMPLLAGRAIALTDDGGAPRVAMVNEAFARHFFPTSSPLGHSFHLSVLSYTIVGVVRDALFHSARDQSAPVVFTAMLQEGSQRALDCEIDIRAPGNAGALGPSIRQAVAETDSRVRVLRSTTMRAQVLLTFGAERRSAEFITAFALMALLVGAVGLYGVVAHRITGRTRELGVRLALGASPGSVIWLVVRDTLTCITIGLVIGAVGSMLAGRVVADQLFGVTPADPVSLVIAAGALGGTALIASLVPTLRAIRIDPVKALRAE